MRLEKLLSLTSRLFFLVAFVLFALAVIERVVNLAGYTLSPLYRPGRMLEFTVVLLVFVITMQLKEMKDEYKTKKP